MDYTNGSWRDDEITEKQVWKLYFEGFRGQIPTKKGIASDLISEFLDVTNPFLAQLKKIRNLGYKGPRPTTEEGYSRIIEEYTRIKKEQELRPLLDELNTLGYTGPKPTTVDAADELIQYMKHVDLLYKHHGYTGPKPTTIEEAEDLIKKYEYRIKAAYEREFKEKHDEYLSKAREYTSF